MPLPPNKIVRDAIIKMTTPQVRQWPAVMGAGTGYARVETGTQGLVWVTHEISGMEERVWNLHMPAKPGLHVIIGEDKTRNPGIIQVLRERTMPGVNPVLQLPGHHATHELYGDDEMEVFGGQFHPLNVIPIPDTFLALIKDAIILAGNVWAYVPEQNVDLTSSVPTAGAKWALLQADNTGIVTLKLSGGVTSRSLLTVPSIPLADTNYFPLCAVKLFDGQDMLRRDQVRNDIVDLRWGNGYLGGGLGTVAGDMIKTVYDPQLIEGDAFSTDNHTDGVTNAFYTLAERAKLAGSADESTNGITVEEEDTSPSIANLHTLRVANGSLTEVSPGIGLLNFEPLVAAMGLDPIDCTAQIVSGGETHFTFTPAASSVIVLLNGKIQKPADVTLDGDGLGVTLAFGAELGDNLIIIRASIPADMQTAGHAIQDDGSVQTQRAVLNFIGATVADNAGNNSTDVTIPTVPPPPVFFPDYTSGVSKDAGTVYQAATDGWLCVLLQGSYMNDAYVLVGTTSTPATKIAQAGDDLNSYTKWTSWMLPIPSGIYYKVVNGFETATITFYPVG